MNNKNMNTKNFMTFYDDYRHNNDEVKIIPASDLYRKHQKRERTRWKTYDKILKQCMREIEKANKMDLFYCFFGVPEMIFGVPVYNLKKCIYYICNVLIKNGYNIRFTKPNIIYISWFLPNSSLLTGPAPPINPVFRKPNKPEQVKHYPVNNNYVKPNIPPPPIFNRNSINRAINKPIGNSDVDSVNGLSNNFVLNRNKKIILKKPKFDFL